MVGHIPLKDVIGVRVPDQQQVITKPHAKALGFVILFEEMMFM